MSTNGDMPNPLKAFLALNDSTAADFAKRLGVSRSYLSRLMAGEREADATVLEAIRRESGGMVTPDLWVKWWAKQQRREVA